MTKHNGTVLAFIGDAVLSLQVRAYLVERGFTRSNILQTKSTDYVSAIAQARFMDYLLQLKILTEEELAIYRLGRNTHTHSVAKNADVLSYRVATGFEALLGHLYLNKDQKRLDMLWDIYKRFVDAEDQIVAADR